MTFRNGRFPIKLTQKHQAVPAAPTAVSTKIVMMELEDGKNGRFENVLHMCYTDAMMKTATIHARINPDIKTKAETILHRLGMTPTEAIRMFYAQITLQNGLPFAVTIPNNLTTSTLAKSYRGEEIEEFDSLDEMFESWES